MKTYKKLLRSMLFSILFVLTLCNARNVMAANIYDSNQEEQSKITTHLITTGSDSDYQKAALYTIFTSEADELIPIEITKKGYLTYGLYSATNVQAEIYADKAATKKVGYTLYVFDDDEYYIQDGLYFNSAHAYISKPGTYYLRIDQPGTYSFISYEEKGCDSTLTNKFQTAYGGKNESYDYDSSTIYYKYKANKTGKLTVTFDFPGSQYGGGYVTLNSSTKKDLSESVYASYRNPNVVFTVKKGNTYYIKVKTTSEQYKIKGVLTERKETSGKKESAATKLTLGKAKLGTVLPEDKTSDYDYYKFTLDKAKKIKLNVKGNASSGRVVVTLYSKTISGTVDVKITGTGYESTTPITTYRSEKLPKGTYYIKVHKYDKTSSGDYSIKVY